LAEKKVKAKRLADFGSVLIPFKNVTEIIKIFGDNKEEVEMSFTKNQVSFRFGGTYLVSRVIDGIFPDYKQIIPKESKTEVVVLKQDLINSLKIANVFSDNFNQISLKTSPKDKILELKTKNSNVGESINKLDAVVEGEDVSMNFNYKYIVDCFQSIDSDSLTITFNGPSKPMIIKGGSDKSFLYLVMPMNR
jgi:DNA polymerase-3 subunit beta